MSGHPLKLANESSSLGSPKLASPISKQGGESRQSSSGGADDNHKIASTSRSGSISGYAARHGSRDLNSADGSVAKSHVGTAGSHAGGSYANSSRTITASRRSSVTERTVTERSYAHKRTASGDLGPSWSSESVGLPSPAAGNTTPQGRYSQVNSYSHKHSASTAALDHSTGHSTGSLKSSPRLSRLPSNKPPRAAPAGATDVQQPQLPPQQDPAAVGPLVGESSSASTAAANAVGVPVVHSLQQDAAATAAAAAVAAQVAAEVAAAARSGALSAHPSFKQHPAALANVEAAASPAAAAATRPPPLPFLQTSNLPSPAAAAAAGDIPGFAPLESSASPTKEISGGGSRLWGFGSPKKDKNSSKTHGSEPSPTKDHSGSRLWGSDHTLRKEERSNKRLSGSYAAAAAAWHSGSGSSGQDSSGSGVAGAPALKAQSSKNKLWTSEAASRAVASIFGAESFNALRKSLSGSGRASASAAAAAPATVEVAKDSSLVDNPGDADLGSTAAAVASILAGGGDSSTPQQSSVADAGEHGSDGSIGPVQDATQQDERAVERQHQHESLDTEVQPEAAGVPANSSAVAASTPAVAATAGNDSATAASAAAAQTPPAPTAAPVMAGPAVGSSRTAAPAVTAVPASTAKAKQPASPPRELVPVTSAKIAAAAAAKSPTAATPMHLQPPQLPASLSGAITAAAAAIAAEAASYAGSNPGISRPDTPPVTSDISSGVTGNVASARSPLVGTSGDYRYPELLFRLQQFLPALKTAGTDLEDFEATWELLKSELTGLVSTAKLASLQAGRLEALDAEVMQMQRLLVEVGRSIKQGAQQQQLQHLVKSFPSYARRQINSDAGSEASTSSAVSSSSSRPAGALLSPSIKPASKFPAARPTAATSPNSSSTAPAAQSPTALQKDAGGGPAAAATAQVSPRAASAAVSSPRADTPQDRSSHSVAAPSGVSHMGNQPAAQPAGAAAAAVQAPAGIGRFAAGIGKYAAASEVTHLIANNSSSSSSNNRSRSPGGTGAGSISPRSTRTTSQNPAGVTAARSVVLPPPPKELTPNEAAQLAGMYKPANDPERISYKTLKVPPKPATSSPTHTDSNTVPWRPSSPPNGRRSPSPSATTAPGVTNLGRTRSGLHSQHSTLQIAAEGSAVCTSTDLNCDPCYIRPEGSSSSWDYAHAGSNAGSSAGLGIAKGFRVMKSIPEAHQKASQGSPALAGTLRRDDAPRTSFTAVGSPQSAGRTSPNRRASSPDRLSPGSPQHSRGRSTQPGGRISHSSNSSSPIAVRHSGIFKPTASLASPLRSPTARSPHAAAAAAGPDVPVAAAATSPTTANVSAVMPPSPLALNSSSSLGSFGYEYVRARSASPNLGMHYLERSPIFKQRSPSHGTVAGSSPTSSSSRMRSVGSPNMLSHSVGSLPAAGSLAAVDPSQRLGTGSSTASALGPQKSGSPVIPSFADYPAFRAACQAFREQQDGSPLRSSASSSSTDPLASSAKLVAKITASPVKDADSTQVDAAMSRLAVQMKVHGVALDITRLGPAMYTVAGRKLRLRMLNGNLLVRAGGGCMDLLVALGKLPSGSAVAGSSSPISAVPATPVRHSPNSATVGLDTSGLVAPVATSLTDGTAYGLGNSSSAVGSPSAALMSHKLGLFTMGPLPGESEGGVGVKDSSEGDRICEGIGGGVSVGDDAWMAIVAEASTAATGEA